MEASRLVESGEVYEIALIDVTLPGMSGIELLERIKCSSPAMEGGATHSIPWGWRMRVFCPVSLTLVRMLGLLASDLNMSRVHLDGGEGL